MRRLHAFAARGAFLWYAHVTQFLMDANLEMRLKVAAAKARFGWLWPVIGVHVRNGDYCSFENEHGGHCLMYRHCICDGFEPYLARIRQMQALYNISTVFLATQDARILEAAQAQEGLRVLALPFNRQVLAGYRSVSLSIYVSIYLSLHTIKHTHTHTHTHTHRC